MTPINDEVTIACGGVYVQNNVRQIHEWHFSTDVITHIKPAGMTRLHIVRCIALDIKAKLCYYVLLYTIGNIKFSVYDILSV